MFLLSCIILIFSRALPHLSVILQHSNLDCIALHLYNAQTEIKKHFALMKPVHGSRIPHHRASYCYSTRDFDDFAFIYRLHLKVITFRGMIVCIPR